MPAVTSLADAQRLKDARSAVARPATHLAYAPTSDDSRARRAAGRIVYGEAIGLAVGLPLGLLAGAGESGGMIAVAVAGYLVGTAVGASSIGSDIGPDSCPHEARFYRALGGSLLGGIVGGGIAGAINGRKDMAAVATAAFGLLSAPVGAAWALWKCE